MDEELEGELIIECMTQDQMIRAEALHAAIELAVKPVGQAAMSQILHVADMVFVPYIKDGVYNA